MMLSIPPKRSALLQHTNRAANQAGHCWGQVLSPSPDLPSQGNWRWIFKEGEWQPFWTTHPDVTSHAKSYLAVGASVIVEEVVPLLECRPWGALLFKVVMTNATTIDSSLVRFTTKHMMRVKWNNF